MGKYRSRAEIVADMLATILNKGGSIKPTRLMYGSNLSHGQMKGYLADLEERGFVEEKKEGRQKLIAITDAGAKYLQMIREVQAFEESFGI